MLPGVMPILGRTRRATCSTAAILRQCHQCGVAALLASHVDVSAALDELVPDLPLPDTSHAARAMLSKAAREHPRDMHNLTARRAGIG